MDKVICHFIISFNLFLGLHCLIEPITFFLSQKTSSLYSKLRILSLVGAYCLLRCSYASRDVDTKQLGNSGEKFFPDTRLHQMAPLTKEFLCEERLKVHADWEEDVLGILDGSN